MINDEQLQQAVTDELTWEPSITSAPIGVTAKEGVVTLSGNVSSYWEKRCVETVASRVKGVRAVVEEIKVNLSGDSLWTDEKIALTW
jgi:osmotically-inducible protein OsmY